MSEQEIEDLKDKLIATQEKLIEYLEYILAERRESESCQQ